MSEWLFLLAAASAVASAVVFPIIVGVRAKRPSVGFGFFAFTVGMYVITVIFTVLLLLVNLLFAVALNVVFISIISYRLFLARIFPNNKSENRIIAIPYSITVTLGALFIVAYAISSVDFII